MPDERHVDDLLGAYVDAELDAAQRVGVETHLLVCAACRRDLEALQSLQATLRSIDVPDPGPGYWAHFSPRVLDRLAEAAAQAPNDGPAPMLERLAGWFLPRGRPAWPRFAGAFAGVMLVSYIGLRGFRPDEIRLEPTKERAAREELSRAPTAPAPTMEGQPAAREPESRVARPDEPPSSVPVTPPSSAPVSPPSSAPVSPPSSAPVSPLSAVSMHGQDTKSLADADKTQESVASGPTSVPPSQQKFETSTPEMRQRSRMALEDVRRAAPQGAPSPAPSGEAVLNLRAPVETEMSIVADASAGPIHQFVAAALAGDIAAAENARTELASITEVDSRALEHMDAWLRQPPAPAPAPPPASKLAARNKVGATAQSPAYTALDALLWPRREAREFRPQVEELARRLVQQAETSPEMQERAEAYLTWLVESTPDAASRAAWQVQLDALAR